MIKLLRTIFVILLLSSCVASQHVKDQATRYLRGDCLALFLGSGLGGYQYVANAPTGRAAFALASDASGQSCGMATNMHYDIAENLFLSLPNVDRVEALAIQRCEQRKSASINAPCRTFARNNEVVWRKALDDGMK